MLFCKDAVVTPDVLATVSACASLSAAEGAPILAYGLGRVRRRLAAAVWAGRGRRRLLRRSMGGGYGRDVRGGWPRLADGGKMGMRE